jgi:hypothetical protein
MYISVIHKILDTNKFWEICQREIPKLPSHILLHQVFPNKEMELCICLWEANTIDDMKTYLESILKDICTNEYIQINEEFNMGLPDSKLL